jgi:hypothetical protein
MSRVRLIAVVLLAILLHPVPAMACPVCFQNVESEMLDAARLGVLALVAVTVGMLVAFGRWFLKLRRLAAVHSAEEIVGRPEEPC